MILTYEADAEVYVVRMGSSIFFTRSKKWGRVEERLFTCASEGREHLFFVVK